MIDDAKDFAKEIGYPVIVRPAFTLGGTGGGIVNNPEELREITKNGLCLYKNELGLIPLDKNKVNITEVLEVIAFSNQEIKLKLKDGGVLTVEGGDLKILSFDNVGGNFSMQGKITSVKYREKSDSLVKRVFK